MREEAERERETLWRRWLVIGLVAVDGAGAVVKGGGNALIVLAVEMGKVRKLSYVGGCMQDLPNSVNKKGKAKNVI